MHEDFSGISGHCARADDEIVIINIKLMKIARNNRMLFILELLRLRVILGLRFTVILE